MSCCCWRAEGANSLLLRRPPTPVGVTGGVCPWLRSTNVAKRRSQRLLSTTGEFSMEVIEPLSSVTLPAMLYVPGVQNFPQRGKRARGGEEGGGLSRGAHGGVVYLSRWPCTVRRGLLVVTRIVSDRRGYPPQYLKMLECSNCVTLVVLIRPGSVCIADFQCEGGEGRFPF